VSKLASMSGKMSDEAHNLAQAVGQFKVAERD